MEPGSQTAVQGVTAEAGPALSPLAGPANVAMRVVAHEDVGTAAHRTGTSFQPPAQFGETGHIDIVRDAHEEVAVPGLSLRSQ